VNLAALWDLQIVLSVALFAGVVIFMLIVLAVLSRRLRCVTSELESVRRDLKLLEDGVRVVGDGLRRPQEGLVVDRAEKPPEAKGEA